MKKPHSKQTTPPTTTTSTRMRAEMLAQVTGGNIAEFDPNADVQVDLSFVEWCPTGLSSRG